MKHWITAVAVGLSLLTVAVQPAAAQLGYNAPQYGYGYRPQLSPYLPLAAANPNATNFNLNFQAAAVGTFYNELNTRRNYTISRLALSDIERQLDRGGAVPEDDALLRPLGTPGGSQFGSSGHLTAYNNTIGYFGTGYPRPGLPGSATSSAYRGQGQPPRGPSTPSTPR
jgi:hypothetical protein